MEVCTASFIETKAVGRRLASLVRPGDVIVLEGGLGAGKTAFTSGLGEGLGVADPITSPTFLLMKVYESGFLPLIHVDAYRLGSLGEFDELFAVEEATDGVLVIEWGDTVTAALPGNRLGIEIEKTGEESRLLRFAALGGWASRDLSGLTA
jgi:tRNA threonylcarbamoyladenosine biosynthesis protein TsaE